LDSLAFAGVKVFFTSATQPAIVFYLRNFAMELEQKTGQPDRAGHAEGPADQLAAWSRRFVLDHGRAGFVAVG
jgi:hypothetical protein